WLPLLSDEGDLAARSGFVALRRDHARFLLRGQARSQIRRDEAEHVDLVKIEHLGDGGAHRERLSGHRLDATEPAGNRGLQYIEVELRVEGAQLREAGLLLGDDFLLLGLGAVESDLGFLQSDAGRERDGVALRAFIELLMAGK